jgi:hypothetical protein
MAEAMEFHLQNAVTKRLASVPHALSPVGLLTPKEVSLYVMREPNRVMRDRGLQTTT